MDITEDKLFDYKTNINKFYKKFTDDDIVLDPYIKIYDVIQTYLSKHNIKLYVGLINNIGMLNSSSVDSLSIKNEDLYYTNTNMVIDIHMEDTTNFLVTFKIDDSVLHKTINVDERDNVDFENCDDFFQKATKYIDPNIIADYLLLCDKEQQNYLLAVLNDLPLEKEKGLHKEITNLVQKIIDLEYDNLTITKENNENILLKRQLQKEKSKYVNACNKIKDLQKSYSTSAYIIGTIVFAHIFFYGVFFVNMMDPNNWT